MLIEVGIRGTSSLFLNRKRTDPHGVPISGRMSPMEYAERGTYRDSERNLCLLGASIKAALVSAAGRRTCAERGITPALVKHDTLVVEDLVPLRRDDGHRRLRDFRLDERTVGEGRGHHRHLRHRARIDDWAACFHVMSRTAIGIEDVSLLVAVAGEEVGVGDNRPETRGSFGTFALRSIREVTGRSAEALR